MLSYWQLRPIYKDLQTHKMDSKTSKVINEEKNLLVGSIKKANHLELEKILANFWLSQTIITKMEQVQKLIVPKILKKADSIEIIAEHKRIGIRKIFDLLLKVTVEKFLDRLYTIIREIAFNMQKSTFKYQVKKPKPI